MRTKKVDTFSQALLFLRLIALVACKMSKVFFDHAEVLKTILLLLTQIRSINPTCAKNKAGGQKLILHYTLKYEPDQHNVTRMV